MPGIIRVFAYAFPSVQRHRQATDPAVRPSLPPSGGDAAWGRLGSLPSNLATLAYPARSGSARFLLYQVWYRACYSRNHASLGCRQKKGWVQHFFFFFFPCRQTLPLPLIGVNRKVSGKRLVYSRPLGKIRAMRFFLDL